MASTPPGPQAVRSQWSDHGGVESNLLPKGVWNTCISAAEAYDNAMLQSWDKSIDTLLIFAALFSAVVTAFIIESYKLLIPDYNEFTFRALVATATHTSLPDPESFEASVGARVLNCLWITSVVLSLLTAIVGILAKQWIVEYPVHHADSAEEKVLLRAFRYRSVQRWHVQMIIAALPVPLHASLLLFLSGLCIFFSQIDRVTSYVAIACSCAVAIAYAYFILHPVVVSSSPYRSLLALSLHRGVAALRGRSTRDPWFTASKSPQTIAEALCSLVSSIPSLSFLEEVVTAFAESLPVRDLHPFLGGPLRSVLERPLVSSVRLELSLGAIVNMTAGMRLSQIAATEDPYTHVLVALLRLRAGRTTFSTVATRPSQNRTVDAEYSSAIRNTISNESAYGIIAIMRAAFERDIFPHADWRLRLRRCLTIYHAWRERLSLSPTWQRETVRFIIAALPAAVGKIVRCTMLEGESDSPGRFLASVLIHDNTELKELTREILIAETIIDDVLWSYRTSPCRGTLLALEEIIAQAELARMYPWTASDVTLMLPPNPMEVLDFIHPSITSNMLANIVHPSLPWMSSADSSSGLSAWTTLLTGLLNHVEQFGAQRIVMLGPLFGEATLQLLAAQRPPQSVDALSCAMKCIQGFLLKGTADWSSEENLVFDNFIASESRDPNGDVQRRWNFFAYAHDVIENSVLQTGPVDHANLVADVRRLVFTLSPLKRLVANPNDESAITAVAEGLSGRHHEEIRTAQPDLALQNVPDVVTETIN